MPSNEAQAIINRGGPAQYHKAITPADDTDLTLFESVIGLFIGGAGNIVVTDHGGTEVTYAVVAGQVLPIRAKQVQLTSTTATGIVALYAEDPAA